MITRSDIEQLAAAEEKTFDAALEDVLMLVYFAGADDRVRTGAVDVPHDLVLLLTRGESASEVTHA